MSDGLILYQKDILRHARSPDGYGKNESADIIMLGDSPICGDHLTVYVTLDGDKLQDVRFDSEACCAICKASSSMMTAVVSGRKAAEAGELSEKFLHMLNTGSEGDLSSHLPEIIVFSKIFEVPSRIECAALAWTTLDKCISRISDTVGNDAADCGICPDDQILNGHPALI